MKMIDKIFKGAKCRVSKGAMALCLGFFALGAMLTGCIDDKLIVQDPSHEVEFEGDQLVFNVNLDKALSSRSTGYYDKTGHVGISQTYEEDMDNYVDTEKKFRVFFFTEEGDFLFGALDRVILNSSATNQTSNSWQVRVPMNVLIDRDNLNYDVDKIKNYLRTHSFKIAVLANWDNASTLDPSVLDDPYDPLTPVDGDENTGSSSSPGAIQLQGQPLWGWNHSVLNPKAPKDSIKNINDLHHLYADKTYAKEASLPTYSFAMKDNTYMGQPYDWVRFRDLNDWIDGEKPDTYMSGEADSDEWIRKYWNPDLVKNENKAIYRHYQYLWQLWDFDAAYNSTSTDYSRYNDQARWGTMTHSANSMTENKWGYEWFNRRNGQAIHDWMHASSLASWDEQQKVSVSGKKYANKNNTLNFVTSSSCKVVTNNIGNNQNLTGIQLGQGSESAACFQFTARTGGYVYIRYGSTSTTASQATITVKIGNTTKTVKTNTGTMVPKEERIGKFNVPDGAQNAYIYVSSGSAVIYSIEWNRGGQYLYVTDREGKIASEEYPIPMYGVQNFEPLTDWEEGTTFDISKELNKNVYLLRSVAKVEVYIPREWGDISHIYMRSLNRMARNEPMNVETPTDQLWKEDHALEESGKTNTGSSEWKRIMDRGHMYGSSQSNANFLKWFYGSWANTKWIRSNFAYNSTEGIWKASSYSGWSGVTNSNSPDLFNPYVNRSDFAHLTYAGQDGVYDRYVIYVPEKFMDDPTTVGTMNSTPKVPHIEYRFAEDGDGKYHNSQFNLEDNDCYRIYFTNYGNMNNESNMDLYPVNSEIKNMGKGDWDGGAYYEQSANINNHWPIMRNHRYQFYLGGSGPESPEVHVKVTDWGHEKVTLDW